MSFVDSGYQGDEAQRAAYEASQISVTVVKRNDTTVNLETAVEVLRGGGRRAFSRA